MDCHQGQICAWSRLPEVSPSRLSIFPSVPAWQQCPCSGIPTVTVHVLIYCPGGRWASPGYFPALALCLLSTALSTWRTCHRNVRNEWAKGHIRTQDVLSSTAHWEECAVTCPFDLEFIPGVLITKCAILGNHLRSILQFSSPKYGINVTFLTGLLRLPFKESLAQ